MKAEVPSAKAGVQSKMKITSILLTHLLLRPTSGAIAKSNGETMRTHPGTSSTAAASQPASDRTIGHAEAVFSGWASFRQNRASDPLAESNPL